MARVRVHATRFSSEPAQERSPRNISSCVLTGLLSVFLSILWTADVAADFTTEVVPETGSVQRHTSMTLDALGNPHISYYREPQADLCYATKLGDVWVVQVVDSIGDMGKWSSIAVDASGNPHISYYDDSNNDLKYVTKIGGVWQWPQTVEWLGSLGEYTSLALDESGNPHISYHYTGGTRGQLRYAVKSGGIWMIEVADSAFGDNYTFPGRYSSLRLDASGDPHIAHQQWWYNPAINQERRTLKYTTKLGGVWTSEDVEYWEYWPDEGLTESGGEWVCLVLDRFGDPHVSYHNTNDGSILSSLKYATKSGSVWTVETVDDVGDTGWYTSISVDSRNNPHVSYYNASNGDLLYAVRSNTRWVLALVDDLNDVGSYTSLALNATENPHISYLDNTNQSLKHAVPECPPDAILYVDADAMGAGDGSSWADAHTELRDALVTTVLCPSVTELWVAEGTYMPTAGTDRTVTFHLMNGVAFYGGFDGTETTLGERDWATNLTVLSGDVGVSGVTNDNSYHVVTASFTDVTAVLDGFNITKGQASGGGGEDEKGGGIYNAGGSPTVTNVWLEENSASIFGGGIYNSGGNPIITNSFIFDEIYNDNGSNSTITNSAILYEFINDDSSPLVYNSILWKPTGSIVTNTGASSPSFRNSLVKDSGGSAGWDPGFGIDLGNNIDGDPLFVDGASGDFRLSSDSPAIDAGDNTAPNLPATDYGGDERIQNGTVDMGAYEYDPGTSVGDPKDPPGPSVYALYQNVPNPFNPSTMISFALPKQSKTRLSIYNIEGRLVTTLIDEMVSEGFKEVTWDGKDGRGNQVSTGVYFYRLTAGNRTLTKKMVLLK